MGLTLQTTARNAAANAVVDLIDTGSGVAQGYLEILHSDGTTVLVQIDLANPAFGAAATGVASGSGLPKEGTASATGTATTWRVKDRDGNILFSGTCGASGSGADMILTSTSITSGNIVRITTFTFTQPAS